MLLVVAGLLVRTFTRLAAQPLGFDADGVIAVYVELPGTSHPGGVAAVFSQRLREAATSVAGADSAAISKLTPLGNDTWNNLVEIPDGPVLPPEDRLTYFNLVSEGWFQTLGTPLVAGRDFSAADRAGAPPVAIVNEAFARRFANGRILLGMRVKQPGNIERRVVGLVRDAVYELVRAPVPRRRCIFPRRRRPRCRARWW